MIAHTLNYILRTLAVAAACLGIWHYLTYATPRHVEYAEPVRDKSENRVVKEMTTQIGAQTLLPQPGNELLPRIC